MGPARFLCATLLKTKREILQCLFFKEADAILEPPTGFSENGKSTETGELAQMVERSLCMREVPGSMPGFSTSVLLALTM